MLCIAPEGFHRHHLVTKHAGLSRLETCCGCVKRVFWTGAPGRLRAMGSEIAVLRKLMQESRCMIDTERSLVSFSLPSPLAISFINFQHPSGWASSFSQITSRAKNDTSARQLFHNFCISLVSREKLKIHTGWSDKRTKHSPASSYASCAEQWGGQEEWWTACKLWKDPLITHPPPPTEALSAEGDIQSKIPS